MRSIAVAVAAVMSLATAAHADLPREQRFMTVQHVRGPGELAATGTPPRTIFMNRCANGCKLVFGTTDSRIDKSQIGQGTLSAYKYGDDPALVLDPEPVVARMKPDLIKTAAKKFVDAKQ